MKKILISLGLVATSAFAAPNYDRKDNVIIKQTESIGTNAPANSKSVLDVSSTTKGFLPPRMTTTQQNAISSPTEGLSIYDNVLHIPSFYNGSAWKDLVDLSTSQTLTNKSLSGAANTFTLIPLSAFTNLGTTTTVLHGNASGSPTFGAVSLTADVSNVLPGANGGTNNGSLTFTNGGMFYSDGSKFVNMGAGSAGQVPVSTGAGAPVWGVTQGGLISDRELIPNTNLEVDASGYNAYADAAGKLPVDGTGGSPNTTCARTTSSPITGAGSLLITKAGSANRQGEGCSVPTATLSTADVLPTIEQIDFDYTIPSGTFTAGSDGPSGVDSDYEVYLYDSANSLVVQPLVFKLYSNIQGHFTSWFQTAKNATTYTLIFHNATTTTNNFTLKIDNISIHPARAVGGAGQSIVWVGAIGSGQSVTANVTDITVTTVKDSSNAWNGSQYVVPVAGDYLFGGVVASSGLSTTVHIYKNGSEVPSNSYFSTQAVANAQGGGSILVPNCKAGDLLSIRSSVSGTISSAYLNIIMIGGNSGSSIPIPVVASRAHVSSGSSTTSGNPFNYDTIDFDYTNSITTGATTWKYTALYPGTYSACVDFYLGGAGVNPGLYKNGSLYAGLMSNAANAGAACTLVSLVAGDTIFVSPVNTSATPSSLTGVSTAQLNYINIYMLPPGAGSSPAGTVSSNSYNMERAERITISGGTTPTITSQSGAWVSSISRTAAGKTTLTFATGMFSGAPTCTWVCVDGPAFPEYINTPTSTSVETLCVTSGDVGTDNARQIICMGPR